MVTTFGYEIETADNPLAEATALGEAWHANFTNAKLADTHVFQSTYILRKNGANYESALYEPAYAGTGVFSAPPPAVAARVTKASAFAGRGFRGRMYLPAPYLDEGQINVLGTIDAAAVTSLQTSSTDLFDDLVTLGKPMHILHADGVTAPTPVVSLTVRTKVGTQRRRQQLT
jgi:hypothetical protein